MNWMQFVSNLVGFLAWPIAALVILFAFKKEIAARLPSLQKLKLPGGVEAEFSKDLQNVVSTANPEVLAPPTQQEVVAVKAAVEADPNLKVLELATEPHDRVALKANPTGVVMEAWKALEATLRSVASALFISTDQNDRKSIPAILHVLEKEGFINDDEVGSLEKMFQMRNLAAHSDEQISKESAAQFAELAKGMAIKFVMRSIKRKK